MQGGKPFSAPSSPPRLIPWSPHPNKPLSLFNQPTNLHRALQINCRWLTTPNRRDLYYRRGSADESELADRVKISPNEVLPFVPLYRVS